jgi:hypothetical protein
LDKTTVVPTSSTLLHVKVPYASNTGNYSIKVNAISENRSHDTTIDLTIVKPGIGKSIVTVYIDNPQINFGETIIFSGQLMPLQPEGTIIDLFVKPPGNEWLQNTTHINFLGDYSFSYRPEQTGDYQVKARWRGNGIFESTETQEKIFRVGLGKTNIWCSSSTIDVEPGSLVDIQINVNPILTIPFDLVIEKPGQKEPEYIRSLFTRSDGKRTLSFTLDENLSGKWKFQAQWSGNQDYMGAISTPLSLYPGVDVGQALIVAGGGIPGNTLWETTEYLCNYFYRILKSKQFPHDQIMYITDHTSHYDSDGDGHFDYEVDDNSPSVGDIESYLAQLHAHDGNSKVNSKIPLIIYMSDHGGTAKFMVNSGEYLFAGDMDQWLDTLQAQTQCLVIVIIDACESGTFIDKLRPEGSQKRILISSSNTEDALYEDDGQKSFSQFLFNSIQAGRNLWESFNLARHDMTGHTIFNDQMPQLYESKDHNLASNTEIGVVIGDIIPEILSTTSNQVISAGEFEIFVEAYDDNQLDQVWASILPPNTIIRKSTKEFETPIIISQRVDLIDSNEDHIFRGLYDFQCTGNYILTFFVSDTSGNVKSKESQLLVMNGNNCIPGDIDNNGGVDLRDVILGLRIISDMEIHQALSLEGDICGNESIGLEEIIYGIQHVGR